MSKYVNNNLAMQQIAEVLTTKFYITLTMTSFTISCCILLFEWWYFNRNGISFIEQITTRYFGPFLGITPNIDSDYDDELSTIELNRRTSNTPECKVWRNPMALFRGAEYSQLTAATGKVPLTFYDMNLSAQDHQTFFICAEADAGKEDMEIMQIAWRERDPETRLNSARTALEKNPNCAVAYILLADEEAKTIVEAEKILRDGLKVAEVAYRKTQHTHTHTHQNALNEVVHRRDMQVLIYIRRRLAMCARKLGKLKEAAKMMRDILKEFPTAHVFSIHENLIEVLLEMQLYPDVQALLAKYDSDLNMPKSATICYTSALLKCRNLGEKFSPDLVAKRGLSMAEMHAVEAIHRAIEFNPHVPKYLLETKNLIFPPEHLIKRGDSEAVCYAFFHLPHWKRVDGALNLLDCTWKGTFRIIPYPLDKGHLFYPYPNCTENTDREILPKFHQVSVYPKKDLPFFLRFAASMCLITAFLALFTYEYPELVVEVVKMILKILYDTLLYILDRLELLLPSWLWQISIG